MQRAEFIRGQGLTQGSQMRGDVQLGSNLGKARLLKNKQEA